MTVIATLSEAEGVMYSVTIDRRRADGGAIEKRFFRRVSPVGRAPF